MAENKVQITIEAIDKAKAALTNLQNDLKGVQREGEKLPGIFGSMKTGMAGFLGVAAGIAAAGLALKSFVDEAAEAEQIEKRLKYALETLGYSWETAKGKVDDFANSMMEQTRFSDDEALKALTDMLMYTRDFTKAQSAATLAMDMSVRTGQDVGSTTRLIGMALSGNVEMLGRYIPEFRNLDAVLGENATAAQKAEYALKILQEKFGGTAKADVNTYSGSLKQFENSWLEFAKTLGTWVLPPLTETLKKMKELVDTAKSYVDPTLKQQDDAAVKRWTEARRNLAWAEKEQREGKRSPTILQAQIDLAKKEMEAAEATMRRFAPMIKKEEDQKAAFKTKTDLPIPEGAKKLTEAENLLIQAQSSKVQEEDTLASVLEAQKLYLQQQTKELERQTWLRDHEIKQDETIYEENSKEAKSGAELAILKRHEEEKTRDAIREQTIYQADLNRMADEEQPMEAAKAAQDSRERNKSILEIKELYGVSFLEAEKIQDLWKGVSDSLTSSFEAGFFDLYKNGVKDLKSVWESFCNNMIESFLRAMSKMAANSLIFGNIEGTAGEGGLFGGVKALGGLLGGLFGGAGGGGAAFEYGYTGHRGGEVTSWGIVPRFHSGLKPDEIPAILQTGERVLSRKEVAAGVGEPTGGGVVVNIFAADAQSFSDMCRRNPGAILGPVIESLKRNGPMRPAVLGAL